MKIKRFFLTLFSSLVMFFNLNLITVNALPIQYNLAVDTGTACNTLNNLNSNEGCGSSGVPNLIKNVVNILSYIVGLIAVVMVIIAGINFTTSGGDANKVASARSTLIYAIVGLVLVILAQIIIKVVIHTANSAT